MPEAHANGIYAVSTRYLRSRRKSTCSPTFILIYGSSPRYLCCTPVVVGRGGPDNLVKDWVQNIDRRGRHGRLGNYLLAFRRAVVIGGSP